MRLYVITVVIGALPVVSKLERRNERADLADV
jgi:hypothetical protein